MSKKALLMILDGWGIGDQGKDDVIFNTPTPYWDSLLAAYPHSELQASGENVGLPDGQMGNSEVGHLNIGAGRIVYQDLVKINRACADGSILKNKEIVSAFSYAKENGKNIHFMGLTSNGGVHSSFDHLFKLCDISKEYGIENTFIHCFMDGRDTDPKSGKCFIEQLTAHCEKSAGKIASIVGRFYAMDRDNRWDRVEKAYRAIAFGEGIQAECPYDAVKASYEQEVYDEFVVPTVIMRDGKPTATVNDGDSIIFFNFRPDRAREITRAFCDDEFKGFERAKKLDLTYVCFTDYDETIQNKQVAFHKVLLKNTFGEYLAAHDMTQVRIAETEKYAHVTFFFNGGVEEPNKGEDRILVNSPKDVATYEKWYGIEHKSPQYIEEAVYGLCEINREDVKKARLVANPGCYTTCSILTAYPLAKEGIIDMNTLIVDAKSGTSGAGRGAKVPNLFCEVNENMKAYGVASHRHTPEIEEQLGYASGEKVLINFTPHLVPMNRGILATEYATLKKDVTYEEVKAIYDKYYKDEKFVRVLEKDVCPETKWVEGSNYVDVNFKIDPRTNRIIMMGAIDNLVKGAAGQAVQNMNLMFGLPETEGLELVPMFP